jgi:hypothetical protein
MYGKPLSIGGVPMSVTSCAAPTERMTTPALLAIVLEQGVSKSGLSGE